MIIVSYQIYILGMVRDQTLGGNEEENYSRLEKFCKKYVNFGK